MRPKLYGHYVARMRPGSRHLASDAEYRWLWARLHAAFPDALAAVLMPNHVHLVALVTPTRRRRLAAILGAFARCFRRAEIWQPVPEPAPSSDGEKLARAVRYAALNPCRRWSGGARLVDEPVAWLWSTHRDVMGLVVDPWIDAAGVAAALGWPTDGAAARLHRYVSSDPSVAVAGTALPRARSPSELASDGLDRILFAAVRATRAGPTDVARRGATRTLFLGLARRQGWRNWSALAARCAICPDRARDAAERCPESWLDAGARCLGEPATRPHELGARHSSSEASVLS